MKKSRISLALRALQELGPRKLGLFALYKLGLKTGFFRWRAVASTRDGQMPAINPQVFTLPDPDAILSIIGPDGLSHLKTEADEIVNGHVRLFGENPLPLNLTPPGTPSPWTDRASGQSPFTSHPTSHSSNYLHPDVKFIWEPARFGWTFTLARAYHLTGDECYPKAFWQYFERFEQSNPVNQGPNWASAQEVALRLIAFAFAAQLFAGSMHSTTDRNIKLAASIANHAARIPLTLIYARSQNNNHLLSEAAGLITASLALPEHPSSNRWSQLGWKWFIHGLQTQIGDDGAYMQQSTNYHRLMLQLALWIDQLSNSSDKNTRHLTRSLQSALPKLRLATRWLQALADPECGGVPNLGPNDGAYILPLTVQPFDDYRPVLQAASHAFLGESTLEPGVWDEMSLWLAAGERTRNMDHPSSSSVRGSRIHSPATLHTSRSWAYLRAVHFSDRPGHADQLHVDLWWRGLNIAQDAGTYLYNADPPWDNGLTHTAVHNTVMVDNQEQMTRAGRFLFLDWAQAESPMREQANDDSWERIVARHDGYRRTGVIHQRSVTAYQDGHWIIKDQLLPTLQNPQDAQHTMRLHWLLPDWEWRVDDSGLVIQIQSPFGWVALRVFEEPESPTYNLRSSIIRAGELLYGKNDISPTWGWFSPTYGVKDPALSFAVTAVGHLPLTLTSEWQFPNG